MAELNLGNSVDSVAQLLKEVYKAHLKTVNSIRDKVEELEEKCKKQEERNTQLQHQGVELQTRFDQMNMDFKNKKRELEQIKSRLDSPCEGCQVLKQQLDEQAKLYNRMSDVQQDRTLKPSKKTDQSEAGHLLNMEEPVDQLEDKKHNNSRPVTQILDSDDKDEKENSNTSEKMKKMKLRKTVKRGRTKYLENSTSVAKKVKYSHNELGTAKNTLFKDDELHLLQATETQPTGCHGNTNILAPETCDPGLDPASFDKNLVAKRSRAGSGQNQIGEYSATTTIVIPETMPLYNSYSDNEVSIEDHIAAPDIKGQSEEQNDDEQTVINLLSSPAHLSTPRTLSKKHDDKSKPECDPSKKEINCGAVTSSQDSPVRAQTTINYYNSPQSEPASPVFGGSRTCIQKQDAGFKLIRSPSLFDEYPEASALEDESMSKKSPPWRKSLFNNNKSSGSTKLDDMDVSSDANESTSVLSGFSARGIKSSNSMCLNNRNLRSPLQVRKTRKLIQTTLKVKTKDQKGDHVLGTKACDSMKRRPKEFDINLNSKTSGSDQESEKNGLCQKSQTSRLGERIQDDLTFAEPQFTSTPVSSKSSDTEALHSHRIHDKLKASDKLMVSDKVILHQVPGEARQSKTNACQNSMFTIDANGTIDPNIDLSQYNTPDDRQDDKLPDLSRVSTHGTQTKSRWSDHSLTQASEDLSHLIFCAGKKEEVKTPDNTVDERSEVKQPPCTEDLMPDAETNEDSFDRLPDKKTGPGHAYVDVVRKQNERRKLKAYTCHQCKEYYDGLDLTEEEKQQRMKTCRHKARYLRPETPEHYWSITFPDTQEAEERGYLNTTQVKPSRFRRKRGLRPLFLHEEAEREDKADS